MGSSGGIAESNNRSSRTTRIQSTRSTTSGGGEGDKSYLCKWRGEAKGGRVGACERQPRNWRRTQSNEAKGARSSRFVVQMTLPIRMLRPTPLLALTLANPWKPKGVPKGSKEGARPCGTADNLPRS